MAKLLNALLFVLIVSIGLLMVGGLVMDVVQGDLYSHKSFFKYRLRVLDDVPFWFAAMLFQLAINGLWLPKLSRLIGESDFSPFKENGRVTWNIPVQYGILFGKNLVLVVGVLFAYLVIKNTYI